MVDHFESTINEFKLLKSKMNNQVDNLWNRY
jgi:hypothetical protein